MTKRFRGLIDAFNSDDEANSELVLSPKQKTIIAAIRTSGHPLQELAEDVAEFNYSLDMAAGHIEARGGRAAAMRNLHEKGIKAFIGVYPDRPGEVYFVVRTDISFDAFPRGMEGTASGKLQMDYRVKLTSASRWDGWFRSFFTGESAKGKWGGLRGEYRDSLRIEPEPWLQQLPSFESPLGRTFLVEERWMGTPTEILRDGGTRDSAPKTSLKALLRAARDHAYRAGLDSIPAAATPRLARQPT